MKFCLTITRQSACAAKRAFTLAEVLAALALMAIVIPVAMEGLRTANTAGLVGHRKAVAMRIAERVLNEASVSSQARSSSQSGVISEGFQDYRWTIRMQPWTEDAMQLLTVQVIFPVQGEDHDVALRTLVNK